jgi:DNA-binding NarL/FixJ family response regulator
MSTRGTGTPMASKSEKSRIRILIADDHTIVRTGFIRLLSLEDSIEIVGEADDGRRAVELAGQLHPDIVIMDIGMPVLNGLEATKRILKKSPHVKVLILSAFDNEQYIHRVVQAGARGYIMKSADANDLMAAIHSVNAGRFVFPESVQKILKNELEGGSTGQGTGGGTFDSLTDREREILQLIAEGKNHQQIAEILHISVRTVDTHRNNIIKKIDVHDTANLVLYAIKNGITILPQ